MLLEYKENGIIMSDFMDNIKKKYDLKKAAYTARLDPMARGQVLILCNEECNDIKKYLNKNKIYSVRIFIGIQTDTDDSLGLITKMDFNKYPNLSDFIFLNYKYNQKYHYYSTKALIKRRRNDFSDSYQEVNLYKSQILGTGEIKYKLWRDENNDIIRKISKNYRQDEIIKQWNELDIDKLNYIDLELNVSNGFFVRQFIRDISDKLNIPLFCYNINRIKIEI